MMFKRKSSVYCLYIAVHLVLVFLVVIHAIDTRAAARTALEEKREMVRSLQLTDLCLFTEARYTRHPALADRHAAFQDGPLSFEHFPSGSLLAPQSGTRHD